MSGQFIGGRWVEDPPEPVRPSEMVLRIAADTTTLERQLAIISDGMIIIGETMRAVAEELSIADIELPVYGEDEVSGYA